MERCRLPMLLCCIIIAIRVARCSSRLREDLRNCTSRAVYAVAAGLQRARSRQIVRVYFTKTGLVEPSVESQVAQVASSRCSSPGRASHDSVHSTAASTCCVPMCKTKTLFVLLLALRCVVSKTRVGIIGLPNVGKSTLFNALARKSLA